MAGAQGHSPTLCSILMECSWVCGFILAYIWMFCHQVKINKHCSHQNITADQNQTFLGLGFHGNDVPPPSWHLEVSCAQCAPPPFPARLISPWKCEQNIWARCILTTFSPCCDPSASVCTPLLRVCGNMRLYCRNSSSGGRIRPLIALTTGAQRATWEPLKCQWIQIVQRTLDPLS